MLLDLSPAATRPDEVAMDAADALRALEGLGHRQPILLACHPPTNGPYYSLLYARSLEFGIAVLPVRSIDDVASLVPIAALGGARVVLHLHWLNGVLSGVSNPAEASRRIRAFERQLDWLLDQHVAIAWTVHNVLPHDAVLPEAELDVRRAVIARASAIHVMAATTEQILAPDLALPAERVIRVPHPAFRAVYPDVVDRLRARSVLGIGPTAPAIGLFGALQPYKGIDELLDALPALAARRPGVRLVIAGRPGVLPEVELTIDRAIADPRVLIHPRHVPDDRVADIMRGVDAIVLPYRKVLNSAALMLALEFGRPVVFPHDPALLEFADPAMSVVFERGSPDALADAIDHALALPRDGVVEAARRLTASRDPAALSRAFSAALRARIDG